MSSISEQQFCLRWHNYQASLLASLPQMLDGDDFTDVTLSAAGASVRAHRVVLSACSGYFKELFKRLPATQHPVIVLPGARFSELRALVTFMYSGEVNVFQAQLPGLLHMADALQVRGLAQVGSQDAPPPEPAPAKKRARHAEVADIAKSPTTHEAAQSKRSAPLTTPAPVTTTPATALLGREPVELPIDTDYANLARAAALSPLSEDLSSAAATCTICGKRLSNPYNLRVHMDTHERAAHACASCPHVSRSRDALRKHVSYRHPAIAQPSQVSRGRQKDLNNNASATAGGGQDRPEQASGQQGCIDLKTEFKN